MTPEAQAALIAARETLVLLHDFILEQNEYIDQLETEIDTLKNGVGG